MSEKSAFKKFVPAILKVYHKNKEAFWSAVMAPFLASQVTPLEKLQQVQIGLGLAAAFKGMDDEARQVLQEFSAPYAFDVTKWSSNRLQYFTDAYAVFAFIAVWLDEMEQQDLLDNFDRILRACVYAVAGYGILDANVDSNLPSPVEVLTAQALLEEYQTTALNVFGVTPINLEVMHRMIKIFIDAEIKEKTVRWKCSPYTLDAPQDLGGKGANAVTPFMLSLERLGKADRIEEYWQVFLFFGAAIQMIDDWKDLEGDLAIGHYSYVTLGSQMIPDQDAVSIAKELRNDEERVRSTYTVSKQMISKAYEILERLQDPCLGRLVEITDARVETFFRKELKMKVT